MALNPVTKVKGAVGGALGFVRRNWLGALLFGMVFAVFAFPVVAKFLGGLRAKGGLWAKVIPASFTR